MSKYETLSKLYHQLTEELDRAVTENGFDNFLLQPKAVTDDPELVPNLLRTKLEPEVENDVQDLHKLFVEDSDGSQPSPEDLERRILLFNAFIANAVETFEDRRDELLSASRPEELQLSQSSASAQAILSALSSGAPIP